MPDRVTKQPQALPTQIAQQLLQRIISGEFAPGTLIPSERELQAEYQVSRAVIREAIKLLESRKLISTSRGQGAVVASSVTEPVMDALLLAFYQSQIRTEDLFTIRILLEPQGAALAAQHATLPQIRRLTELAKQFEAVTMLGDEAAIAEDLQKWGKIDREFHQLIAEASQNAVFSILITVLIGIVWNSISAKVSTPSADRFTFAAAQHQAIARAIAERDAAGAEQAMREHVEISLRNIISPEDRVQIQLETLL